MKNHVVKYHKNIKKIGVPIEATRGTKVHGILSKAGLPEETLVVWGGSTGEPSHSFLTILLPSGEAFTGFAIKKEGDKNDDAAAACIAAGRAVAVWKAQFLSPEERIIKVVLDDIRDNGRLRQAIKR